MAHDLKGQIAVWILQLLQLDNEAFAQVAGTDARRIEGVNYTQHASHIFWGETHNFGNFFGRAGQVPLLVNIADEELTYFAVGAFQIRQGQLLVQLFNQW